MFQIIKWATIAVTGAVLIYTIYQGYKSSSKDDTEKCKDSDKVELDNIRIPVNNAAELNDYLRNNPPQNEQVQRPYDNLVRAVAADIFLKETIVDMVQAYECNNIDTVRTKVEIIPWHLINIEVIYRILYIILEMSFRYRIFKYLLNSDMVKKIKSDDKLQIASYADFIIKYSHLGDFLDLWEKRFNPDPIEVLKHNPDCLVYLSRKHPDMDLVPLTDILEKKLRETQVPATICTYIARNFDKLDPSIDRDVWIGLIISQDKCPIELAEELLGEDPTRLLGHDYIRGSVIDLSYRYPNSDLKRQYYIMARNMENFG